MGSLLLALGLAASAAAAEPDTTLIVEVNDSFTGAPLPDICVFIDSGELSFFDNTAPNGTVTAVLPPAEYLVTVFDCENGLYPGDFAGTINVFGGGTMILSVELEGPATVTGTVTSAATGEPLYRACIDVFHPDDYWREQGDYRALSDEAGRYSVPAPAGEWFFRFSDCSQGRYSDVWRESAPNSADPRPVLLASGLEYVVDAALPPAAFITGTVTNELTGTPVPGICVWAEEQGEFGSIDSTQTTTGLDGTYEITGLRTANYVVSFQDCLDGGLLGEYYDDVTNYEDATLVTTSAGQVAVVDAALAPEATLSGMLVDAVSGQPLAETCVKLYDDSEMPVQRAGTQTNASGRYDFERLRPGSYRVLFSPPDCANMHAAQWYPDAAMAADAVLIEIGPGEDIVGVDAALSTGSTIAGTITDAAGDPVPAGVVIHHPDFVEPIYVPAREDGSFTSNGLPVGDYRVHFPGYNYIYAAEWYDNVLLEEDATVVSILANGTSVTGIDAVLVEGGHARGTVVGLTDYPNRTQCVNVYDLAGNLTRFGYTGPGGVFHIGGIPPGNYRINTEPCPYDRDDFLTIWFGGSLSEEEAEIVTFAAGQTIWNLDINPTRFAGFDPAATVALVDDPGRWHTINGDGTGATFYFGLGTDQPVLGDWDCDGTQTPGMFRPSNGFFYLTNTRATSFADTEFYFGQGGDIPLAGDWNNDGCDTVGVYRPAEGKVYLRNTLDTGVADIEYYFGQPGDMPFAGDFNADGTDEIALHRPSSGQVYLRYTHTSGEADLDFYYGTSGDHMFAGDWNGDGTDTLGVYRPSTATTYLTNTLTTSAADTQVTYGTGAHHPAT